MTRWLKSLLSLTACSTLVGEVATAQYVPTAPIQVSSSEFTEGEPVVAAVGEQIVAFWSKSRGTPTGYGYSLDRGRNWFHGGLLLPGAGDQIRSPATITADSSGNFYVGARVHRIGLGRGVAIFRGGFTGSTLSWVRRTDAIPLTDKGELGPDHLQIRCHPSGSPLYLAYTEAFQAEGIVKVTRSLDGGQTWSPPLTLSGNHCNHSRAALGPDGELYVIWHDEDLGQIVGRKSFDQAVTFTDPFVVSDLEYNRASPAGWANPDGRVYADCRVDHPRPLSVTIGRDSRVYVAWSERASGIPRPLSGNRGEIEPNEDFSNATPIAIGEAATGSMFGNESADITDCDHFVFQATAGQTLWIGGGACGHDSFGNEIGWSVGLWCDAATGPFSLGGQRLPCTEYCSPAVFTLPTTGTYYLSLGCTNSSSLSYSIGIHEFEIAESSVARDHRDIVLASSPDGGTTWSPKVKVNDDIGYDNALPAVAVDRNNVVHVAWYDRREDPACSGAVHTRWTYSSDQGATFAPSVRLSDVPADLLAIMDAAGGLAIRPWFVGDHLALEMIGDEVQAFWAQPRPRSPADNDNPAGDIWTAIIRDDVPTGTLVSGFWAEPRESSVRVTWRIRSTEGIRGFRVHRAEGAGGDYRALPTGPLPVVGTDYEAWDREITAGSNYRYRLEVMRDSESVWQGPIEVSIAGSMARLEWQDATPNPFIDSVALKLAASRAGAVRVAIYDLAGHEVRRLHQGALVAGTHTILWDGRDNRSRAVAPGIYLVRATVGETGDTRRIVRIE